MRKGLVAFFTVLTVYGSAWARGPSDAPLAVHLGPGFLVGGGVVEPGVGVGLVKRVTRIPIRIGVDAGVFFLRNPVTFILPILATVYYRFPTRAEVIPTIGLSFGPVIGIGSGAKAVNLMVLASPGFQFYMDADMDLFFRSSLGFMGSSFVFYPQIGATFRM